MTLSEKQEFVLWKKTEMYLRSCNDKLTDYVKQNDLPQHLEAEANELIIQNNREIKGLARAVFNFATSEA